MKGLYEWLHEDHFGPLLVRCERRKKNRNIMFNKYYSPIGICWGGGGRGGGGRINSVIRIFWAKFKFSGPNKLENNIN